MPVAPKAAIQSVLRLEPPNLTQSICRVISNRVVCSESSAKFSVKSYVKSRTGSFSGHLEEFYGVHYRWWLTLLRSQTVLVWRSSEGGLGLSEGLDNSIGRFVGFQ